MSKKKYVIESAFENVSVQKIMQLGLDANGRIVHWTDSIANIEELNSDYINEHFSDLQDTAYQKGFEDGKKSKEKGCDGCKYEWYGDTEDPCWHCRRCYKDKYEPAPHSDSIEVGDEVIDKDGDTTIVTNIHERLFDGLCSDGSTMSDLFLEDVRKTGRHYDHIGKLLEAIRA